MKLNKKDIKGMLNFAPTPSTPNAGRWDEVNSIDHDKTAIMEEKLIQSGVNVRAMCGTTGENAALLWDEKREYFGTVVKTIKKRIPVFAGCTALGTKETIRQMRAARDIGADGAFVGLPLWQTPTIENSIQWYADLSEALPDFPIMVYGNEMFFKSNFPVELWEGIAKKAPTLIACKGGGSGDYAAKVKACGNQVMLVPSQLSVLGARKTLTEANMDPSYVTALWTVAPWPEPWVALINAINAKDEKKVGEIRADLVSVPGHSTEEIRKKHDFAQYNAQVCRHDWNSSGYIEGGLGPSRPPYRDIPEDWKAHIYSADRHKKWEEMRKKYLKVPVK